MLPSAREQCPAQFVTPSQFNMPPTAYPLTEPPTSLPPILAIDQSNIIAISAHPCSIKPTFLSLHSNLSIRLELSPPFMSLSCARKITSLSENLVSKSLQA